MSKKSKRRSRPPRGRVDWVFDEYVFERVTIKEYRTIDVREGEPKTVLAEFNVVAVGGDQHGSVRGQTVPRFLRVWLRQDGDRWLITDHEDRDFREGLLKVAEEFGKHVK